MSRTPSGRTPPASRTSRPAGRPRADRPGASPGPALPLVRRFLRQEENDTWAVRLLPRVVFGVAALYTVIVLASRSGSSFVAVVATSFLGLALWLMRRRTQLLLALGVSVLAVAFTGYFSAVGDAARRYDDAGATVTGQAAFGYWALAGMALLGAWMVKDHPGRRGVTVVLADVILVIASGVGMFLPEAGVPLGFLGVLAVLALRGGTAKAVTGRARRAFGRVRPGKATEPADS
ncbi:hypothetical protein [Streptomyces sp. NPDC021608]|uniref:hypothetical protein n=1 Tax=Streptomyces sp. NPDC021608 TaxID=3154903 RepID=UPI0033D427B4